MAIRALLIEDEFLVAMMVEDMLGDMGIGVVSTCATVPAALSAVEKRDFDFALLDANLGGASSAPVADRLAEFGIPFLYATGYGAMGMQGSPHAVPVLQKPFQAEDLKAGIAQILPAAELG